MRTIGNATWGEIEAIRGTITDRAPTLAHAAQDLTARLRTAFSTVVLARLFSVTPLTMLPSAEQQLVEALHPQLPPATPILTLLGSSGIETAWCDRTSSKGHRVIPLLSSAHVSAIPMVAKLLADLQVDLSRLDSGGPIVTRRLAGSSNNAFFVPDARESMDDHGRHIIGARDFVTRYGVRTVFGMGGAHTDGTLVAMIVFTNELIEPAAASRFASLIGSFKIATSALVREAKLFE